jgi:hypothetical protein
MVVLNGWRRLWVAFAGLCAILVGTAVAATLPPSDDTIIQEFSNGKCANVARRPIEPNMIVVLWDESWNAVPDPVPAGAKYRLSSGDTIDIGGMSAASAADKIKTAESPDKLPRWVVRSECLVLSYFRLANPSIRSVDDYKRDLRRQRAKTIGMALFAWAAGMLTIYLIGAVVAWIRRGFTHTRTS